jgi:hypothetical protein
MRTDVAQAGEPEAHTNTAVKPSHRARQAERIRASRYLVMGAAAYGRDLTVALQGESASCSAGSIGKTCAAAWFSII